MRENILIAVPSLRGTVACATAKMFATSQQMNVTQDRYAFHVTTFEGVRGYAAARNAIAGFFLAEPRLDRLWMIDDDIIPGTDIFNLLEVDADIVSPIMVTVKMRIKNDTDHDSIQFDFPVCAYKFADLDDINSKDYVDIKSGGAVDVDGTGFGCTIIKRRVLEDPRMRADDSFTRADGSAHRLAEDDPPPIFQMRYTPNGTVEFGEDIDFCYRARRLGYTVKLHTGVEVGHNKMVDARHLYHVKKFYAERANLRQAM